MKYLLKISQLLLCRKIETLENVKISLWNVYQSLKKKAFSSGNNRFIFVNTCCFYPPSIPSLRELSLSHPYNYAEIITPGKHGIVLLPKAKWWACTLHWNCSHERSHFGMGSDWSLCQLHQGIVLMPVPSKKCVQVTAP